MTKTTRDCLLILLVAGSVFFTNLGGPRLWDRDEPRNAGCAAEMLAANDWVTPIFNAELRPHKPVLLYWFMMTAYSVLGVNEFAARFWSAAFGTGSMLIVYFSGRRLFGRSAALWSAIIMGTTLMFGVASRAATPDAVLIFFSTLALGLYVRFTFTESPGSDPDSSPFEVNRAVYPLAWGQVALMFAVMGCALLAKGPIGLILPTAVIGMFLLIKRLPRTDTPGTTPSRLNQLLRRLSPFAPQHFLKTCWHMRPLTALGVSLAVALPWYVWVHLRTDGAWTEGFFITHNLARATTAMEGHQGGIWFYPLALLIGFSPWSIFWLPALLDSVRVFREQHRWRDGHLFACCWVGVYLALFSIARTKLPSYITPCYPGMALLTGAFIDRWTRRELELHMTWHRLAFGSLLIVGLAAAIALPMTARLLLPGEEVLGGLGLVLLIAAFFAWSRAELGQPMEAMRIMAVSAVILMTTIFGFASIRIDRHRHLEQLALAVGADHPETQIVSFAKLEPSWVFYWKRPIREFLDPAKLAQELRSSARNGHPTSVITTASNLDRLKKELDLLPVDVTEVPYFLDDENLIVIRPHALQNIQTATAPDQRTHH